MKRFLFVSVTVLAFSMFMTSVASAECPPGRIEVTIVNRNSGKVMTICVAEAAAPYIGGRGDVVIPATCPCFTAETIEELAALLPDTMCELDVGSSSCGPCTYISCYSSTAGYSFDAAAGPAFQPLPISGPVGAPDECTPCQFSGASAVALNRQCWPVSIVSGTVQFGSDSILVSEAEGDACVAILKTFDELFGASQ